MKTWTTWTNLSLFVNGVLLGWTNETPSYPVRDSGAPGAPADSDLYLGYDPATGPSARFKGIVDEFRLYKTAPSTEGVRGLLWFLHGANNAIIPRGVFYKSKLYGKLNETDLDSSAPVRGWDRVRELKLDELEPELPGHPDGDHEEPHPRRCVWDPRPREDPERHPERNVVPVLRGLGVLHPRAYAGGSHPTRPSTRSPPAQADPPRQPAARGKMPDPQVHPGPRRPRGAPRRP